MPQSYHTIRKKDFIDLLSRLAVERAVFVPYKKGEELFFALFDSKKEDAMEIGGIRQSQPVKSFINPPREEVLREVKGGTKGIVIVGVKGCDLNGLAVQDFVFQEGDVIDPYYVKNRKEALIIAHDCTYARETCFCVAMNGLPYPQKHFDISLSSVKDSYVAEVVTDKGRAIVERYKTFFKESSPDDLKERDARRKAVTDEVRAHIATRGTPEAAALGGIVKRQYNLIDLWKDAASTCVECGACNLVCPTCHCFFLYDYKAKHAIGRGRIWDACLYKTFARVAGGANPRRHLYERLRNRFDKKFSFFPDVMQSYACTGCGRCIEACPGDIDIREVLKGLVSGKWNKPPHK